MSRLGSSRSSQFGIHQFALPRTFIDAGTTSMRMTVASSRTATARPSPNILISALSPATKLANTANMIAAAAVMTRALADSPWTMADSLSWSTIHASRMRDRMNTS